MSKEQFGLIILQGLRVHCTNGFPSNSGKHMQLGVWLRTLHSAFWPHTPGHGSLHF